MSLIPWKREKHPNIQRDKKNRRHSNDNIQSENIQDLKQYLTRKRLTRDYEIGRQRAA